MKIHAALITALALAACANKAPSAVVGDAGAATGCAGVDWVSIGQRDGLYGEPQGKLDERAAECSGALAASHRDDYARGRQRGLNTYCTTDAAYDAGRNGRDYQGACPAETEAAFLASYGQGRKLFDQDERVANTKTALATAIGAIESDRFELKRALTRVSDMNATAEDKSRAVANVERYRQNIGRLEDEIPKLEAAIAEAQAALKARAK